MRSLYSSSLLVLLLLCQLVGCHESAAGSARQRESSHLRALVNIYNFAASKLGHRPASEAELKTFIAANGGPILEPLHLNNADELFVSERDGEAFVVNYRSPPAGAGHDVVAYERTGVDGRRQVAYSLGAIEEVDEQRFAELVPATNPAGK
jgi:hypothetical protein